MAFNTTPRVNNRWDKALFCQANRHCFKSFAVYAKGIQTVLPFVLKSFMFCIFLKGNVWYHLPSHWFGTTQRTQTSLGCLQDIWKRSRRLTTKPDVFMTSSRRRRIYDVLKTSYLRCLEDIRFMTSWERLFYDVLKTSHLRRLEDVGFMSSGRRPIYNVLKTSDLWRLGDVWFTTFWRHLIYIVLRTSDFRRFEDVWFTTFWRRLIYNFLMTYVKLYLRRKQRLHNVRKIIFSYLVLSEILRKF